MEPTTSGNYTAKKRKNQTHTCPKAVGALQLAIPVPIGIQLARALERALVLARARARTLPSRDGSTDFAIMCAIYGKDKLPKKRREKNTARRHPGRAYPTGSGKQRAERAPI